MSKGSSVAAQNALGSDQAAATTYGNNAAGVNSQLTPFLESELTNPQGYGQQTLSQMQTQGGQATSGALGAGKEAATLAASRTGNPSAVPGIIDATTRDAMRQQSNNVLGIDTQNADLKQKQQQAGAAGLNSLYGTDVSAALKSLGLEDESINAWTQGRTAVDQAQQNIFNDVNKVLSPPPGSGGGGGG